MRIYLDTSAWGRVCDARLSRHLFDGHEVLFSSCNLDEFAVAPLERARELAQQAWRLSNRKKLHDHIEIMREEVRAYQLGTELTEFAEEPGFNRAWLQTRTTGPPSNMAMALREFSDGAKRVFRDDLRYERTVFRPLFEELERGGLQQEWPAFIAELRSERRIGLMIKEILRIEGFDQAVPNPELIHEIPYLNLPGTTATVEYLLALRFLAAKASGKLGKPDFGDQVDCRHACYAGLADLFVTQDQRMREILTTMVTTRARIVDVGEMRCLLKT